MAAKKFQNKDKGHIMTQEDVDALKDENGRLPDEAYTPETLAFNLNTILHQAQCPTVLVNDFLQGVAGLETSPLVHMVEGFELEIDKLQKTFTDQGCTLEELAAGALHLQADIIDYNEKKAIEDGSKNKTLH